MQISQGLEFFIRLTGALLYILFGMVALANFAPQAPAVVFGLAFFALIGTSTILFNEDLLARIKRTPIDAYTLELERKGKATRETILSKRSLFFEDLNTSSPVYLIDVPHKGLLCLYGQYLYQWSPIDDDPEMNQPRGFPCSEFDVIRRKRNGVVLELELRGSVYEPEEFSPSPKLIGKLAFPIEDGKYLPDVTYEAARAALRGG
jgi:hypothetical protein